MTRRMQALLAGGVVAIGAAIAYANGLHGPFVFDDPSSITGNTTIRHLSQIGTVLRTPHAVVTAEGRPVLNLSLAINYAIGGGEVLGYHVLNVLIHLCAGLALWGILRRVWREDLFVPTAIALLWGVHPLQTESVTYTVQRAESLMGLFYFLTIYCFMRFAGDPGALDLQPNSGPASGQRPSAPRRSRSTFAILSVVCCFLGMATKEDMASAPVIVLFLDRTFFAGSFAGALRLRWRLYAALASSWLLLGYLIWWTGGNRGGSVGFHLQIAPWDYWLTQFPAVITYLKLAFWPHPLVFEYGTFWVTHWSEVWPQAVGVGLLAAGTVWALVRRPALGFAGIFFFALLAPTSLLPGTTQMIVEHRMYLPLAALLAVAIGLLARWGRRVVVGVAGVAAAVFLVLTWQRNRDYRSAVGLWELTVRQRPRNVLAQTMLGQSLENAGRSDEARVHFLRATQLNPRFALAQEGLGENCVRHGDYDEAIRRYRAALRLSPNYADAHDNLGVALGHLKRWPEAIAEVKAALKVKPDFSAAHFNLGQLYLESGRPAAAVPEFEQALALYPQYSAAYDSLGNSLRAMGRLDAAEAAYRKGAAKDPKLEKLRYNWALVLLQLDRKPEAAEQFQAAVHLKPDDCDARDNLGGVLLDLNRPREAEEQFRAVLALGRGSVETHFNLGTAYQLEGRSAEARAEFETCLKMSPGYGPALDRLK